MLERDYINHVETHGFGNGVVSMCLENDRFLEQLGKRILRQMNVIYIVSGACGIKKHYKIMR